MSRMWAHRDVCRHWQLRKRCALKFAHGSNLACQLTQRSLPCVSSWRLRICRCWPLNAAAGLASLQPWKPMHGETTTTTTNVNVNANNDERQKLFAWRTPFGRGWGCHPHPRPSGWASSFNAGCVLSALAYLYLTYGMCSLYACAFI